MNARLFGIVVAGQDAHIGAGDAHQPCAFRKYSALSFR